MPERWGEGGEEVNSHQVSESTPPKLVLVSFFGTGPKSSPVVTQVTTPTRYHHRKKWKKKEIPRVEIQLIKTPPALVKETLFQ
jgi:hypothetical protein